MILAYSGAGAAVNATRETFYTPGYPWVLFWTIVLIIGIWLVYELYNDTH